VAVITWSFTADLDSDGTYETDLTSFVDAPGSGISIDRRKDRWGGAQVSTLSIALRNSDGRFTPENTGSPIYGRWFPGFPVRLTATHSALGYTAWTGYARTFSQSWAAGAVPMVTVGCSDLLEDLQRSEPVTLTVTNNETSSQAVARICAAIGFTAADQNLDAGVQTFSYHFAIGQPAGDALVTAAVSELGGDIWIDALGRVRLVSRNSRLGILPDDTWGDGTNVFPSSTLYEMDYNNFATTARVRGVYYQAGQADTELLRFSRGMNTQPTPDSFAIGAGLTYEIVAQLTAPYVSITLANGQGTDKSSALTVTVTDLGSGRVRIKILNTDAGTVYLTLFRLRGQPLNWFADRPEFIFTKSVPGRRLGREIAYDVAWLGDQGQKARDFAYSELRIARYPYPRVTLHFDGGGGTAARDDAKKAALLAVELGDLIKYKDSALTTSSAYLEDWWRVEGIKLTVPPNLAGASFGADISLAPSYLFRNLDAIAYDTFDRADAAGGLGTSTSEDVWSNSSGFDIVSGKAKPNTAVGTLTPDVDLGVADMVVETTWDNINGVGGSIGIIGRKADANNYLLVVMFQENHCELWQRVAGVASDVVSGTVMSTAATHEVRMMCQGTRVRVWVDQKRIIDTTAASATLVNNTKAGLYSSGQTTLRASDFYAQGLAIIASGTGNNAGLPTGANAVTSRPPRPRRNQSNALRGTTSTGA
jgi:hypothetical protein